MNRRRINVLTKVNSRNVSREGEMIVIRDVTPIVDGIVMNGLMYPGEECRNAVASLDQVPAPAGHPQDDEGNFISACKGKALAKNYIGAHVTNARHANGVTYCDIVVNESQAMAMDAGKELIARLNAAMNGERVDPIHVSTGLFCQAVQAVGSSKGKEYRAIASAIEYDHLAILLDQQGAGTPDDGVGMWLNAAGEQEQVETVTLYANEDDGMMEKIKAALVDLLALFAKDMGPEKEDAPDDEVEVDDEPTVEVNPMKDKVVAALNAAGVSVEGMSDDQVLGAYVNMQIKPVQEKLTAANAKLAEIEANERTKQEAEKTELSTKLATNSALTVDDFKAMPVERLRELAANAAPILLGNQSSGEKQTYVLPD